MKIKIMAKKNDIMILSVVLFAALDANELSCKSSQLLKCDERKNGMEQSHLGLYILLFRYFLYFHKISNSPFKCKKQEVRRVMKFGK